MSSCSAVAFLAMGIFAPLGGRLNDRFGPRLVLGVSGAAYGSAFILLAWVTEPWHMFLIFGTLVGIGLSTHDIVTLSTIARWFYRRRGIMTGIVKVGTATGQIVVPPLAALLIIGFGWRTASMVLGLSALVLLSIAALSVRFPSESDVNQTEVSQTGLTYSAARKTRIFWTLCAIQFTFIPSLFTVPLHLAVHGMDLGMTEAKAATLLSVIGGASIVGRLAIGGFVDKIGGKRTLGICFLFLVASLFTLMNTYEHNALFVAIAIYGFAHGGLFTVVSPTIAENFGLRAHSEIFGSVLFFGTIGGAIAPILAGLVFDMTGSYKFAFMGLAVLATIGFALVSTLPKLNMKVQLQLD